MENKTKKKVIFTTWDPFVKKNMPQILEALKEKGYSMPWNSISKSSKSIGRKSHRGSFMKETVSMNNSIVS